jgi:hypothetical protein
MWIATKQVEIMVRVEDGPASLSHLMGVVSSSGSEVLAACSYWDQEGAIVMLVTENALRAVHALEAAGYKWKSSEVVLVEMPERPGMAAMLGAKLADAGVNILYSYAFRSERDQSYMVFKTADDDRAIYLLEVESLIHDVAATKRCKLPALTEMHKLLTEPQAV